MLSLQKSISYFPSKICQYNSITLELEQNNIQEQESCRQGVPKKSHGNVLSPINHYTEEREELLAEGKGVGDLIVEGGRIRNREIPNCIHINPSGNNVANQ